MPLFRGQFGRGKAVFGSSRSVVGDQRKEGVLIKSINKVGPIDHPYFYSLQVKKDEQGTCK